MNHSKLTYGQATSNAMRSSIIVSFTFSGKERDAETGLSYFGARYYDADLLTGWLSVDPMSDKYPSMSPYNYCAGNPVKLVDPDGMDTINIHLDKGAIDLIKADGDHSIQFYKDGNLVDSDVIFEDKCRFQTFSDYMNNEENTSTTYLRCSESSVGVSIFEKITKLDSNVEWDFYSAKSGGCGELSSSGYQNKMMHRPDRYTAENVCVWKHFHPKNCSDSFYPSHSDQDLARKLGKGVKCTIYHDGKSMEFGNLLMPRGHITIRQFGELWYRFAR